MVSMHGQGLHGNLSIAPALALKTSALCAAHTGETRITLEVASQCTIRQLKASHANTTIDFIGLILYDSAYIMRPGRP